MEFVAWFFSVEAARRGSQSALPDAPIEPHRPRRRLRPRFRRSIRRRA